MTDDELRSDGGNRIGPSDLDGGVYDDEISLWPLIRALWGYRTVIAASVSVTLLLFFVWGFGTYVFQPSERIADVEFQLVFDGAARGRYPNGLGFSRGEIVAGPVMQDVYASNELERYLSFKTFRDGIFVQESNPELEFLALEYQDRLGEAGMNSVERMRLETEYEAKRETLQVTGRHSLTFISAENTEEIPDVLLNKVLTDILLVWAEQAVTRRGVLTYEEYTPTISLLDKGLEEKSDYWIRVDHLRGQVNRVVASLRRLQELPGASFVRVGDERTSLDDILFSLKDLETYRLDPLVGFIQANMLSLDSVELIRHLDSRRFAAELDAHELEGRLRALQESLRGYDSSGGRAVTGGAQSANNSNLAPRESLDDETTITLGDSFLSRLVAIVGDNEDKEFRRELTDRIVDAGQELVGAEREVSYYERIANGVVGFQGSPQEAAAREFETRFQDCYDIVSEAIELSNVAHRELSATNLDPRTALYSVTAPLVVTTARAVSLGGLVPTGLFTFLSALVVMTLLCLVHYYIRREILPTRPPAGQAFDSGESRRR